MNLFDVLESNNLQWNTTQEGFYVWTPGYKHADCYTIEKRAMKEGYICLTMKFDKQCGKTLMKFKKQPNT